jgi:hypothetical protein
MESRSTLNCKKKGKIYKKLLGIFSIKSDPKHWTPQQVRGDTLTATSAG